MTNDLFHIFSRYKHIVGCRGGAQLGRGLSTGWLPVGPAKVKACKSILFTEGSLEVKITDRMSDKDKSCHIALSDKKIFLVNSERCWTLSRYLWNESNVEFFLLQKFFFFFQKCVKWGSEYNEHLNNGTI